MPATSLFKGVAVVIDDEVNDQSANIQKIVGQITGKNIPVLKLDSIPGNDDLIGNLQNISFVLLDWRFENTVGLDGVRLPAHLEAFKAQENIDFIKKLLAVCFCPIFIFTNDDVDDIKPLLIDAGLYFENKPNNIFLKKKGDLERSNKLFVEVNKWINSNPSMYVLKEWEREYQKSKNAMFNDFQKISPMWPKIMWDNFSDDGGNKSFELGELISRNLHTRMKPFEFSPNIMDKKISRRYGKVHKEELRRVMEGERFLGKDSLHPTDIGSGDVFKKSGNYFINIRASCDLVPRNGTPIEDISLYLLKGSKISDEKIIKCFDAEYGMFPELDSQSIMFPLNDGKMIDFRFKDLKIESWRDFSAHRIGRVLPPYISRLQQRYALYLQRHGLPRTPKGAVR